MATIGEITQETVKRYKRTRGRVAERRCRILFLEEPVTKLISSAL
jgi:hypothetical protein